MAIQRIKYANQEGTSLRVFFDDGSEWPCEPYPSQNHRMTDHIQPWLDAGGTIEPYQTDEKRLEDAKTEKGRELRAACRAAIQSGFTSDALGTAHTYPSKQGGGYFDQSNLSASVTESLLPGLPTDWSKKFWCADGSGNWQMRPHSAAQIQQVGQAGSLHVSTNIELCDQKVREVEAIAADTSRTIDQRITDIKAVTW